MHVIMHSCPPPQKKLYLLVETWSFWMRIWRLPGTNVSDATILNPRRQKVVQQSSVFEGICPYWFKYVQVFVKLLYKSCMTIELLCPYMYLAAGITSGIERRLYRWVHTYLSVFQFTSFYQSDKETRYKTWRILQHSFKIGSRLLTG